MSLVQVDGDGTRTDAGARFGILQPSGNASFFISNGQARGVWHFDGGNWIEDPAMLRGLGQAVKTVDATRDNGVRLRDTDNDGHCEIIVGNPETQAVLKWSASSKRWQPASFNLPPEVPIVRRDGTDNGTRFVDINKGRFSRCHPVQRAALFTEIYIPQPIDGWFPGWPREVMAGPRTDPNAIPMIVRGGEQNNNGAWFHSRHLWIQNEDTAHLPNLVDRRSFDDLLRGILPLPKSPQESLRSMEFLPGYRIELMAAEPLVADPVAFEWDEAGRLWVAEMADYPLGLDGKGEPGGRVRWLEDRNGDGGYDHSTVFLDGLAFPTGVMPWRDGVLISAAPDILFARDTDGDGRADESRVLFTGFGEGNHQHRMNGFEYGLDNWVYGANGDSGGVISSPGSGRRVNIRGRDFRFRPDTLAFQTQTGQTQYGRRRDDWGNWFGNNNPSLGWHYTQPGHYLRRNPHFIAPSPRRSLGNYDAHTRSTASASHCSASTGSARFSTSPPRTAQRHIATSCSANSRRNTCLSARQPTTWCAGNCCSQAASASPATARKGPTGRNFWPHGMRGSDRLPSAPARTAHSGSPIFTGSSLSTRNGFRTTLSQ
ncbi:MAG: hypothetical protein CM1200mP34_5290 [Verrucomicrobiales bacterium]|nr:MAG: hypothetical protein CM1200mP34_5290 [Verrucomicrobiales bacterium]